MTRDNPDYAGHHRGSRHTDDGNIVDGETLRAQNDLAEALGRSAPWHPQEGRSGSAVFSFNKPVTTTDEEERVHRSDAKVFKYEI